LSAIQQNHNKGTELFLMTFKLTGHILNHFFTRETL